MKKGFFITLEGGEGTGKTTQINRLSRFLTEQGRKVITTREPGGTPEGDKLRDLVVQRDGGSWTPLSELLLISAARDMHVQKLIKPSLEEGKIIISDRFYDSTRAYQGYAHGLDLGTIETVIGMVAKDCVPDLTLILDIDPQVGLSRSNRRLSKEVDASAKSEDKFEGLDLSFHEKLRNGFLAIAKQEPERCVVIDAAQDIDKVTQDIEKIVLDRLG